MIGPLEKGFNKATLEAPIKDSYEGVDLSILPKYVAYKAALLKEKNDSLLHTNGCLTSIWITLFYFPK